MRCYELTNISDKDSLYTFGLSKMQIAKADGWHFHEVDGERVRITTMYVKYSRDHKLDPNHLII